MTQPYSVVVAGSTIRTLLCAQVLASDDRFAVTGVITPTPRHIGRKHVLTKNPLHLWAEDQNTPIAFVEKKVDTVFQKTLDSTLPTPHFLLVVDFGYIIPQWLLDWPEIAPLNVHPSALPKYRGSSPGQFALIHGEQNSAVTIMVMDARLDHGPIIRTIPFVVEDAWLAPDYYAHAFSLVEAQLADTLAQYVQERSNIPQPDESPTPIARQLTRDDGFIPLASLRSILSSGSASIPIPFLTHCQLASTSSHLYNLWRGLHPWPGLWTKIQSHGEDKRMKLLDLHMEGDRLFVDKIQIEGKEPQAFFHALLQS